MGRYMTIVIVSLISIGADHASNIHYTTNDDVSIYAEHLDSIRNEEDINDMVTFLNGLSDIQLTQQSVILYISPATIGNTMSAPVLKNLTTKNLVHLLCVDECHRITSSRRYFRPKFHQHPRYLVGLLWNKCPMLFCSSTMTRSSIYHTALILHPGSPIKTQSDFSSNMGLDDIYVYQQSTHCKTLLLNHLYGVLLLEAVYVYLYSIALIG